MSSLQEFFVFLTELFQESGGAMNPETVKSRLGQEGYDDVTAYDVKEAVGLMYEEGDVFSPDQSSVLNAYTGGNQVDQSFNGSGIGTVNSGGVNTGTGATTSAGSSGGSSGGGTTTAPSYTQTPAPPMDPAEGYTDLDAAVQQIVYVSNITNNTTINDQDTFEDNDTIIDASVDQNIVAAGDVKQSFDTTTLGDEAINVDGDVDDSNLVTGDNDGVIADDVASAVVGDNNETQTFVDSNENITGDGNTVNDTNIGGDNFSGDGSNVTVVEGNNDGVIGTGDGDVEAINDSVAGQTAFGDGDITNVIIDDSHVSESQLQIGDDNDADLTSNDTLDASVDASVDIIDIDNSAVLGSGVAIDGDADGSFSGVTEAAGTTEVGQLEEPQKLQAEEAEVADA